MKKPAAVSGGKSAQPAEPERRLQPFSVCMDLMFRPDNISKQHGHQILFIDASMGIQKGEKVGLVGPNVARAGSPCTQGERDL